MAISVGSLTRPHVPLKCDWGSCSITRLQLDQLATQGYLSDWNLTSTRPGLVFLHRSAHADNHTIPHGEERVCFVPFLLRGLGFPIPQFLRRLLAFHRIQLHHLMPNSILHIAVFVAVCKMYLECEEHFGLWRKYFCLMPCSRHEKIHEVGGAEVWRIAGTSYLPGTHREDTET